MGILQLITKFILDPKGFEDGSRRVESATRRVTGLVDGLKTGLVSGLQSALRTAFNPVAALVGGAGLLALGHDAVTAAIGFDTIQRSLTAVTQSAKRAKEVLKFTDDLSGPSIFTSEDLAQAGLTLEAFKLTAERFLPVAEKLATVFGSNKGALDSYVSALGYIKNGRFGEGFESLTRAGLSRSDFEAEGLVFDKGGSFQGSAEEALDAIERLVNQRFGKLSEEMASGPAAKLASVMDAIGRASRQAGFAILSVLLPAAQQLGGFISYLVNSGALEKAFNGIARLFNGQGIGNFLVRSVALLVATIQRLPMVFVIVRTAAEQFFGFLRDNLKLMGAMIIAAFAFGPVLEGIGLLVAAITRIRQGISLATVASMVFQAVMTGGAAAVKVAAAAGIAFAAGYAAMNALDTVAGQQTTDFSVFDQLGTIWSGIQRDAGKMEKGYAAGQGPTGTANTIVSTLANALSPTKQIAEHTRKTAVNTEKLASIQNSILGGGMVGKGAMSAVNLNRVLSGSVGSGGGDKLTQAVRLLRESLREVAGDVVVESAYQQRGRRD